MKESNCLTLEQKRKKSTQLIKIHVSASLLIGFTPIPFSDTPLLIANQANLVDQILKVYEVQGLRNSLNSLITKVGLGFLVSKFAIKTSTVAAAQLLKFIPALGSFAGGLINATVATSITYAFGLAVDNFCYQKSLHKDLDTITTDDISNFIEVFESTLKSYPKLPKL